MNKITFLIALVFLFSASKSFAQIEVGAGVGISEYGGDLANTPFIFSESKVGGSIFGAYSLTEKFDIKASLGIQKISGDDANKDTSRERNLSFENTILDLNLLANYSLYEEGETAFNPYIYAGLGIFKHNPKAEVDGTMVELQPLGTEGQGIEGYAAKYDLIDFSIPFGLGVKYEVDDDIYVYLDLRATKTTTDYLDDVGSTYFANPTLLLSENGETAYKAAYKSNGDKGWPTDYAALNDDAFREIYKRTTSEGYDDWYYLISVGGSYQFLSTKKKRSQIWRNKKGVPYR